MSKMRNLSYFVMIAMLLFSGCEKQAPATSIPQQLSHSPTATAPQPSHSPTATAPQPTQTATPQTLPELDPEVLEAMKLCDKVLPGQVCLVQGPVKVIPQPGQVLWPMKQPGNTLTLGEIKSLKLGTPGSSEGLMVMRIETEWTGGSFTILAFGEVELVNEAPYGTHEFHPMQALSLTTAPNQEGQPPTSGLFVSSPEDGKLSTLVVNGQELSFGSAALLTSQQGGLSIQTLWGSVGIWLVETFLEVFGGERLDLTRQEIEQGRTEYSPAYDPAYETVRRLLEKYFGPNAEVRNYSPALEHYFSPQAARRWLSELEKEAVRKKYRALEELRRKQQQWKGGWWKMTYGPTTSSGQCGDAVGDGGSGSSKPYTTEIPICRGNNGNTILMYDSGVSYDRISSNLYAKSHISEFDFLGKGTIEGSFDVLQVVSPTRMILSHARTTNDSCTSTSMVYLDFLRDDPDVRCGIVFYIESDPYFEPELPTPTPVPQDVEPPVDGRYPVRIVTLPKACDPAAASYAPSFTTADLSLLPENKLVLDTASTKYELELSDLTYTHYVKGIDGREHHLGIFSLQQPVDSVFNFTLSLVPRIGHRWIGNWLVANEDGSQLCAGSIDLFPPD